MQRLRAEDPGLLEEALAPVPEDLSLLVELLSVSIYIYIYV